MTEDVYAQASDALLAAVATEVGPWIERRILAFAPALADQAAAVGADVTAEVAERLRALVDVDIDEQRGTPLEVVRSATRHATVVLRDAGVSPVRRDEFSQRADPDDDYDLSPATWADLGPESAEAGLIWGAAKAMVHLNRHRPPAN